MLVRHLPLSVTFFSALYIFATACSQHHLMGLKLALQLMDKSLGQNLLLSSFTTVSPKTEKQETED